MALLILELIMSELFIPAWPAEYLLEIGKSRRHDAARIDIRYSLP